jgi:hypothetical protein
MFGLLLSRIRGQSQTSFSLFLHKYSGVLSDHLLMEYDYLIRKGIGKGKVHPRTGLEGSERE